MAGDVPPGGPDPRIGVVRAPLLTVVATVALLGSACRGGLAEQAGDVVGDAPPAGGPGSVVSWGAREDRGVVAVDAAGVAYPEGD